jgi:hypothetical protein
MLTVSNDFITCDYINYEKNLMEEKWLRK